MADEIDVMATLGKKCRSRLVFTPPVAPHKRVCKVEVPNGLGVCDIDHFTNGAAMDEFTDLSIDRSVPEKEW